MTAQRPHGVPTHLPTRLTISLWDFSWYTCTAPGEAFDDLDRAFDEAVERGYNAVRICAMPHLLFGEHTVGTDALEISAMGGNIGRRTRWYDVQGGTSISPLHHLLDLFRSADRHDCYVILSSWEYQQSPAFAASANWYESLVKIDPHERHRRMAESMSRLVGFLQDQGLSHRIAYAELHNEVDLSRLAAVRSDDEDPYWGQKDQVQEAVELMHTQHPDVMATASYGIPPYLDMGSVPDGFDVAHFHLYVYGVLGALERWAGVRTAPPEYPTDNLKSLLRSDAPPFADYLDRVDPWRFEATGISASMFYTYDWVDTVKWDLWLYQHLGEYRIWMADAIDERLGALGTWAHRRNLPLVIGEGWIGYTPLLAEFEDGPVGQALAERAVDRCIDLSAWGTVLGSNSAPHHPGWGNVNWQRRWNRRFLDG